MVKTGGCLCGDLRYEGRGKVPIPKKPGAWPLQLCALDAREAGLSYSEIGSSLGLAPDIEERLPEEKGRDLVRGAETWRTNFTSFLRRRS